MIFFTLLVCILQRWKLHSCRAGELVIFYTYLIISQTTHRFLGCSGNMIHEHYMNIQNLVRKEFKRFAGEKRTLVLIFLLPILTVVIFGLTSGGSPTETFQVAVYSFDNLPMRLEDSLHTNVVNSYNPTLLSGANSEGFFNPFLDSLVNETDHLQLVNYSIASDAVNPQEDEETQFTEYLQEIDYQIQHDQIDAAIILPANFSECLEENQNLTLILHIDAADIDVEDGIESAINECLVYMFRSVRLEDSEASVGEHFLFFSPSFEYTVISGQNFIMNITLPIIISFIIVTTTMSLTTLTIVSEGPLSRMMLTPMGRGEMITAKFLSAAGITFIQTLEFFVGLAFFGLYVKGSLLDLFLAMFITGICSISVGLTISAVSNNEHFANQMYIFMITLVLILSGEVIPFDQLPPIIDSLSYVFPLRHSVPMIQNITLHGFSIDLGGVTWLLGLSGIFLLVAYLVMIFRRVEV